MEKILQEALPLKVAKKYTKLTKDYKKPRESVFKGRDRIVLPDKITAKDLNLTNYPIFITIQNFLIKHNYITDKDNYIKGLCFKKKKDKDGTEKIDYNNPTKIGKILEKYDTDYVVRTNAEGNQVKVKKYLDTFMHDPIRMGKDRTLRIIVSRHPYDLAGMSTDREWNSCMNLGTQFINYPNVPHNSNAGINKRYVENDITHGALIAYLVDEEEKNSKGKYTIKRPLARILLKPWFLDGNVGDDDSKTAYDIGYPYRNNIGNWRQVLEKWVNDVLNKDIVDGQYVFPDSLYDDPNGSIKNFDYVKPNSEDDYQDNDEDEPLYTEVEYDSMVDQRLRTYCDNNSTDDYSVVFDDVRTSLNDREGEYTLIRPIITVKSSTIELELKSGRVKLDELLNAEPKLKQIAYDYYRYITSIVDKYIVDRGRTMRGNKIGFGANIYDISVYDDTIEVSFEYSIDGFGLDISFEFTDEFLDEKIAYKDVIKAYVMTCILYDEELKSKLLDNHNETNLSSKIIQNNLSLTKNVTLLGQTSNVLVYDEKFQTVKYVLSLNEYKFNDALSPYIKTSKQMHEMQIEFYKFLESNFGEWVADGIQIHFSSYDKGNIGQVHLNFGDVDMDTKYKLIEKILSNRSYLESIQKFLYDYNTNITNIEKTKEFELSKQYTKILKAALSPVDIDMQYVDNDRQGYKLFLCKLSTNSNNLLNLDQDLKNFTISRSYDLIKDYIKNPTDKNLYWEFYLGMNSIHYDWWDESYNDIIEMFKNNDPVGIKDVKARVLEYYHTMYNIFPGNAFMPKPFSIDTLKKE